VIPRKRRTREHVIADLSANHVERYALLCGFSVERIRLDYGIDLIVHTYSGAGEVENGRILFQLKATDRLRLSSEGRAVSCRLERADLSHWLREPMPVILALYDARASMAYWLYVQAYFERQVGFDLSRAGTQVTVTIPCANVLDRKAMRRIARHKQVILTQLKGRIHHVD
jgi:hypothetical protein